MGNRQYDSATLAIRAIPANHLAVQVCVGVAAHKLGDRQEQPARIVWQWDDGAWSLSTELRQRDLLLTIMASDPGELKFLKQPGSATGRGHYVPTGLRRGRNFYTMRDPRLPL
ncbi:hypothetical protein ACIOZM_20635 [Pseudomonas sp. NPDC087346]|uniref:hypothetical protein n=1 Tax=Pseudomonas sp. NPDC087346 TaxID=3364438 RepID=UPI003818426B